MWQDIKNNRTKILGYLIAAAGFFSGTIAAGTFMGMLEPNTITLLGILCGFVITVFGGSTAAVGHSNTTREKVAEAKVEVAHAMEIAILTPPPPISPTGV